MKTVNSKICIELCDDKIYDAGKLVALFFQTDSFVLLKWLRFFSKSVIQMQTLLQLLE
jgi:hypothetical protein